MSKYIIELDDRIKLVTSVGVTENGVVYTTSDYVHNLEELNSDYINEHYGDLQDTAYQRGLDDAWEAAMKIVDMWDRIDDDELLAIFGITERIGYSTIIALFGKQTASEAIAKLKAYEEKQNDKIEVGDTVDLKDAFSDKGDGVVTKIVNDDCCYIVWYDGSGGMWAKGMLVKTGKHIDIASILEDMRND